MNDAQVENKPTKKEYPKLKEAADFADALDKMPWATILGGLIVVIAALVGAVIVVIGESSLNFDSYVNDLSKLAIGVGLVAVGRGIHKVGKG